MNHYTADGDYVLDDAVPQPAKMYRIKLLNFGEPMAFGIKMTGGISDSPISERELEKFKAVGMPFELVPVSCEQCTALQRINEELGQKVAAQAVELALSKKKK